MRAEWDAQLAPPSPAPITLSEHQIRALAGRWHDQRLREEERQDQHQESLLAVLSTLEGEDAPDALFTRSGLVADAVDRLLKDEPVPCDEASRARLHGELLRQHKSLYRLLLRRAKGDHTAEVERFPEWKTAATPGTLATATVPLPPQPAAASQTTSQGLTVGELMDRYDADPKRLGIRERSKAGYAVIYRVLKELLGADKPVKAITREDCRQVRDVLLKLPPNYTKRFPRMTAKEAAEEASRKGVAPLAPGTVDGYLENLAAVFNWAVAEEYMERNPAKGLGTTGKVKAKDKRLPFTLDQLQAIFSAPLYTGCRDDEANYAAPGPNHPRRARFWVPLLSLWTGMRLNECCQLLTSDVRALDGVPCLFISEEVADGPREAGRGKPAPVKRVKTEAGERFVPIHPELIRIGFLKFAEKKRAARAERLFPELSASGEGYFSDAFSKWFSRFLASRNAKTSRTSFHSFRHCYRDAMTEARLGRNSVLLLGGWEGGKTDDGYGGKVRASFLLEEISKVAYPGLDLGHLRGEA
ncbi:site-specific integrase [Methylocella silvestris]|uniref:site-specific integrase n=1 Tax=Methylocella silvestris TaxID=199596 RepID=UPI0011AF2A79|nr:site-specific integrase [Methylocella silvestris]